MLGLYQRYQQGYHQQVYDELLALGEQVFDPAIDSDFLGMGEYISIHDEILTFLIKDLLPF